MATIFTFHTQHYRLTNCKFLLHCCEKSPGISLSQQETNKDTTNTFSTICFHIHRNVSCFTVHGIRPYEEQTICFMCSIDLSSATSGTVYTQKELVLLETLISNFEKK